MAPCGPSGGELGPRQRGFEVSPDPRTRVQLWAIGRQAHEAHVGRQGEPRGRMGPAVVREQGMQAIRDGLGESLQEEPVARRRLHGAIGI
jgi:hypothetical protein